MSARVSAPAARAPRKPPARTAPAVPGPPPRDGIETAAWVLIAIFGALLVWIAFGLHVVGDYSTESDFYGGYAEGARMIRAGHVDFRRYPVVGPGYEFALALLGLAVRDAFTAARMISVASALAVMVLWWRILRRHAGAATGFWALAFLASNAVFLRYAYSSTTDLLAMALQAACLHAVLTGRGRASPFASGVFAALATLTRYNSVYLVPAALIAYLGLLPAEHRRRSAALHLAGFALIAAPWFGLSLAAGQMPGRTLFDQFGSFYTIDDASRNVQDQTPAVAESLAALRAKSGAAAPPSFAMRTLANVPGHLREDAFELLGWPIAALCVAGLALALAERRARALLPVWVSGGLLFATLTPVFYSDRYSMALLPAYASLAGAAMSSRGLAARFGTAGRWLPWLAGALALALAVQVSIHEQQRVIGNQPVETIEAGRALAAASRPGERVICRKAQVSFYAGREAVPFPRLTSLAELADYARRLDAGYLYYSWYEANLRAEFAYLLDTTAAVPGLTVLHRTEWKPSVLYRIGPEFGATPDWYANRPLHDLHLARANVQYRPPEQRVESYVVLAADALERGRPSEALEHLRLASAGGPLRQGGWRLLGHALRLDGQPEAAARAYERALEMEPRDLEARLGLGWAQLGAGHADLAALAWRPAIGALVDSTTLLEMARLFDARGDRAAAEAARTELRRLASPSARR